MNMLSSSSMHISRVPGDKQLKKIESKDIQRRWKSYTNPGAGYVERRRFWCYAIIPSHSNSNKGSNNNRVYAIVRR